MSFKDTLFTVHTDHLENKVVKNKIKKKEYKYGYDKDLDCVVISMDGTLGEIYEIQGLRIGLPKMPDSVLGDDLPQKKQFFRHVLKPESLKKIKSIIDFREIQDEVRKSQWAEYIEIEWNKRTDGTWFMCDGEAIYLTGSNYFFLNYHKIDNANRDDNRADFRHSNRIWFYFLEACKADPRCYGMCYLKNRRSGFSHMAASESVNVASKSKNAHIGILSKTATDAKQLFTEKVVGCSRELPFYFRPLQAGMDNPKTELVYAVPSVKLTRKSINKASTSEDFVEGLDTKVTWLATNSNSYDGFKLKMLVHDESGKWEKPNSITKNWSVTKTCLRLGRRIVGKVLMGSTSNALDKGGEEFKDIYYGGDLTKVRRNAIGQTPSGMYSFFINALWNMEGFFDVYGWPVFDTPEEDVMGVDGALVDIGSRDFWQAEVDGMAGNQDMQHEYTRQFPLSEKHAFRDEAVNSLFNLVKIYQQVDHNEDMTREGYVTIGSFQWKGGQKDTEVEFHPSKNGRFHLTWIPPKHMQNARSMKQGILYPANETLGAFGCDPYDISGAVGGGGSKGALTGVTGFTMYPDVPNNKMFLEYIARPQTADIFFEDMLMAMVFYGMPALIENNKVGLLRYLRRRGYRKYVMNRPDRTFQQLSKSEIELGGIPNSSEDVKQAHAAAIESYIEDFVGTINENGDMGDMYFSRTLEDWARFDITDRTAHDASISSGLALMGINKFKYRPRNERQNKIVNLGLKRYNNDGARARIIK